MDTEFPNIVTDRYKIIRLLGQGGMGDVYLAEDTQLPRKVAIKLVRKEFLENEEVNKRIERESKLHAKIGTHSNIVTLYDVIKSDDGLFVVLEYIDGQTLAEIISENSKNGVRLSESVVVDIVQQSLKALSKIHSAGVIHRDIKPENLFIGSSDEGGYSVKLMDFGIAKADPNESSGTKLTKVGSSGPGTPSYMAPEQIDAYTYGEISPATDLYALGIIFYELMTGSPPFGGSLTEVYSAHLIKDVRDLHNTDRLTNQWRTTICKALEKNQADRYATAKQFSKSIAGMSEQESPEKSEFSTSQDATKTKLFRPNENKTRLATGHELSDLLASATSDSEPVTSKQGKTKIEWKSIFLALELPQKINSTKSSILAWVSTLRLGIKKRFSAKYLKVGFVGFAALLIGTAVLVTNKDEAKIVEVKVNLTDMDVAIPKILANSKDDTDDTDLVPLTAKETMALFEKKILANYPQATLKTSPAPKSTVPKTTAPKTTAPKTTAPKTTVPKASVPKTTVSKSTAPTPKLSSQGDTFQVKKLGSIKHD